MSESVVHLRFPARPDYLVLARLTLSGIARELPLGDEMLADLKLALTEACGNVVRHAYTDSDGDVSVAFTIDDSRILMTVRDSGDGIRAPDAIDETAVEGPLEGGMGMSIIRAIVDELEVKPGHDGQGTIVRMVKYLTPPS
ncbi:MAG: ATP-binding protein [Gaiellaceae bacterium]